MCVSQKLGKFLFLAKKSRVDVFMSTNFRLTSCPPPPLWGFSSDFSLGPLVGDPWVQGILRDFVTHKYPLFLGLINMRILVDFPEGVRLGSGYIQISLVDVDVDPFFLCGRFLFQGSICDVNSVLSFK